MSDRSDTDPTVPTRTPRKAPSHPKLEAQGWDRDDPAEIIRNSLAKFEGETAGARQKLAEQVSDARASTRAGLRRCGTQRR